MRRQRRFNGPVSIRIERIDPLELDLGTADEMADIGYAIAKADGIRSTSPSGPTRLKQYQHGSDGTPAGGIWLARDDSRLVGMAAAFYPWRENTDMAGVRGGVHPDHRGRGIGRALLERVRSDAAEDGRTKIYSGTMQGTAGEAGDGRARLRDDPHLRDQPARPARRPTAAAGTGCTTTPPPPRPTTSWSASSGRRPSTRSRTSWRSSRRSTTLR